MKIVAKKLTDIGGSISTDETGQIVITCPPTDQNGYQVVRIDASGLKDVSTASVTVFIEDRSDDEARLQELIAKALEIKNRLEDTTNPPSDLEKAVLYNQLADLDKQVKAIYPELSIYNLI